MQQRRRAGLSAGAGRQVVMGYLRRWYREVFRHEGVVGELFLSCATLAWLLLQALAPDHQPMLVSVATLAKAVPLRPFFVLLMGAALLNVAAILMPREAWWLARWVRWVTCLPLFAQWALLLWSLWIASPMNAVGVFYGIPVCIYAYSALYLLQPQERPRVTL